MPSASPASTDGRSRGWRVLGQPQSLEERIAREDILRLLGEKGGEAREEDVAREVGDAELASRVIANLVKEGLLEKSGSRLVLTEKGRGEAENLLHLHREAERLLARLGEPHEAAHAVEHFGEALRVLRRLPLSRAVSLTELPVGGSGYVVAVRHPLPRVIARLVGAGVVPGRRVRVAARLPTVVLVEVGASGRLVALDRRLAESVLVVPLGSGGGGAG